MKSHFEMLAAYNQWANSVLYDRAALLPDADYRADRGAFFGSLHATLNHLLLTDRLWMNRFTGQGPTYAALDLILHDDLASLATARQVQDELILSWVESLSETDMAGRFTYRTITNPITVTQPLGPALAHFFNHQTHHRGQAHALLTAAGGREAAASLDMILFQRQTGIGMS